MWPVAFSGEKLGCSLCNQFTPSPCWHLGYGAWGFFCQALKTLNRLRENYCCENGAVSFMSFKEVAGASFSKCLVFLFNMYYVLCCVSITFFIFSRLCWALCSIPQLCSQTDWSELADMSDSPSCLWDLMEINSLKHQKHIWLERKGKLCGELDGARWKGRCEQQFFCF